jgi:hypothetical protein
VLHVGRDPERADEVGAGAARQDCQLDAVVADEAVDGLVDGAVAADDDDAARAALCGLGGELDEVARPLREQRVADQADGRRTVGDLGPAAARASVVGGRVDQEDRLRAGARPRPRGDASGGRGRARSSG